MRGGLGQTRPRLVALSVVIAVGAVLRWLSPGRIALWRDEVQFIRIAGLPDTQSVLTYLYNHESHPPLFYLLGALGKAAFGSVEAPMGVVALLASIISIYLVYLLGCRTVGPTAAVAAAAATALSMSVVIPSIQLRPYGLISALMLSSQLGLIAYWTDRRRSWIVLWGVSLVSIAYLHHLAVLFISAQAVLIVWVQSGDRSLGKSDLKVFFAHAGIAGTLMVPAFWWLVVQSARAGYPSLKPFSLYRPFGQLASLGLSLPFQVLLPLLVTVAVLITVRRRSGRSVVFDGIRPLITGVAPVFLALLTIASYKSQFLLSYIAVCVAPFAALLIAGHVTSLISSGFRWRALIWGEFALALFVIELLLQHGFMKTNTDLVARSITDRALPADLIILMPGAAGASFNRYYRAENTQINYPYRHRMPYYPFDGDFSRVADPDALGAVLDSVSSAFDGNRRVWLVTLARWLDPSVPAPLQLSRDSFGGIGQADRSRANHVDRYLRGRYGPPRIELGADDSTRGQELLIALLFTRDSAAATISRTTGDR